MRRSRILSSLLVASLLVPAQAVLAQEEDTDETEADETEGAEVVDEDAPARPSGTVKLPPGQTGRESAPGEVHTVEKGDTLWDLSQRYLGTPWYWPKVWSYNPEIANPHWIYPGNSVRFFAAGEEVPSRVETGNAPAPVEMVAEAGEEMTEATEMDAPSGEDAVSVSGKIGYEARSGRKVITQGFLTAKELDEAGTIDSSFAGGNMISWPDNVYLRFKRNVNAKLGDRYVVFHTLREVSHPATGQKVGFLTEYVGTLRVVQLGKQFVTAQIVDQWDAISRGDLVGPYGERLAENIVPRPNEKKVEGHIITALEPNLTMYGEHHFVVVDRGSKDGVQVGNLFSVIRQNDMGASVLTPSEKQDVNLPVERVATCMATEIKERTANCILTQSVLEVVPGDRVVMYVDQGPTSQR
jgi:hypothetical protein